MRCTSADASQCKACTHSSHLWKQTNEKQPCAAFLDFLGMSLFPLLVLTFILGSVFFTGEEGGWVRAHASSRVSLTSTAGLSAAAARLVEGCCTATGPPRLGESSCFSAAGSCAALPFLVLPGLHSCALIESFRSH
jgi:hypothetical protein